MGGQAQWLEGCMCALLIAAVLYAALYLCRTMWTSNLDPALCNAATATDNTTRDVSLDIFWTNNLLCWPNQAIDGNGPVDANGINVVLYQHVVDILGIQRTENNTMRGQNVADNDGKTGSRRSEDHEEELIGQEPSAENAGIKGAPTSDELSGLIDIDFRPQSVQDLTTLQTSLPEALPASPGSTAGSTTESSTSPGSASPPSSLPTSRSSSPTRTDISNSGSTESAPTSDDDMMNGSAPCS